MAISRRTLHSFATNGPACACSIFHHEAPTRQRREAFRNQSGSDIGGTTCGEGDDNGHRPLRKSESRQREKQGYKRTTMHDFASSTLHVATA
jgi:hypothetical protein